MIVYYKSHGLTLRRDPEEDHVAIILSDKDKENIANMAKDANIYCVYSDSTPPKEVKQWLVIVQSLEEGYTK